MLAGLQEVAGERTVHRKKGHVGVLLLNYSQEEYPIMEQALYLVPLNQELDLDVTRC
jgi:hypothetical protein